MAVNTLDPTKVEVILDGRRIQVEGISTEMSGEQWVHEVSPLNGRMTRVKQPQFCTVTLTLFQTSPDNALLSSIYNLEQKGGAHVFPLLVKDTAGGSITSSPAAFLEGMPGVEYNGEVNEVEWSIVCSNTTVTLEGNV